MGSIAICHEKPSFGSHNGVWEYRTYDDEFLCYIVRYEKNGSKSFCPYVFQDGKWFTKWFVDAQGETKSERPIYGLHKLKKHPDKKILIVEGEKTADAAQLLFPEYIVLSWMGGSGKAKNVDIGFLKDRLVCLWPDNDKAGFQAMELLKKRMSSLCKHVAIVNPQVLGVEEKWDLADFDQENDVVDFELVKMLVEESFTRQEPFDVTTYPDLSGGKNPRPLDTAKNLKHLLDFHGIKLKWNMMKRIREVEVPGVIFYGEEAENAALSYVTDIAVLNDFNIRRIDKHMDRIAWENVYHPVRDWIESKELEDKDIFNKFLNTIQTTNNQLSYLLIKRWMVSAIASLFNDSNFCAQGVLVLQGETGTHKSSFIMSLVPEPLRAVKGGASLDPSKKDDILTLSAYWIVELGELDATFRKADIARLKSHITNDIDDVRRPYAARNSHLIRRTVYAATVNESKFLVDTTGNRRWWTVSVTKPIHTRHGLDMQQVWRCAYDLWKGGEPTLLSKEELILLNQSNEEYEFIDPLVEKLDAYFDFESPDRVWMTSTQVLMNMGYDKPSKSDCTRMGTILSKRGITKGEGRLRRSHLMPRSRFDKYKTEQ